MMCRRFICLTLFCLVLTSAAEAQDPSLVGWWKLDETSGTVATDSSGNGNDGTVYGDAQWITGYTGGGLEFDGEDDYVDLPIGSTIASLSDCTIATWANFSNTGGAWQRLWDFGSDTTYYMFLCPRIGTGSTGILRFAITKSSNAAGAESQLDAPETLASGWHHVAVVIDGVNGYMYLYLDGAVVDSGETETLPSELGETTQNWLGRSMWEADGYYNGSLDDVRIYNRVLSEYQLHTIVDENYEQAWKLRPDNGQQDVAFGTKLVWNPGVVNAETGELYNEHQLYIGTDFNDVDSATVPIVTLTDVNEYSMPFDYDVTYYWRVDEASSLDPNGPVKGNVSSFTALNFIVVEDFEDYNDWEPYTIYLTWIDGYGIATNGSTAGYPAPIFMNGEHYVETTIVHSGAQSMPLFYDNTTAGLSEVTRTFNADWTQDDVVTLTLFYYGDAGNLTEPMYVALNGDAVVTNDDPKAVLDNEWNRWDILLQDFADQGVDLTNVETMSIGMGDKANPVASGSTGHVFFDDIRLYRSPPIEIIEPEPVDPGTDNLVAYYAFENNTEDGSGNGLHGTTVGNPQYVSGPTGYGMAMEFDSTLDHVELPIGSAIASMNDITISCWADFSNLGGAWQRLWDFGSGEDNYMFVSPRIGTDGELRFAIATTVDDDTVEYNTTAPATLPSSWHNVAVTIDSASMTMKLYQNGRLVAEGETPLLPSDLGETNNNYLARSQWAADAFYRGSIDEFRIYDRALSVPELLYLAGR